MQLKKNAGRGRAVAEVDRGIVLSQPVGFVSVSPLLILLGIFFFGPIVALTLAVLDGGLQEASDLFSTVLTDKVFQTVALRTIRISLIVTLISVVVGYAMAYAIWRSSRTVRSIALGLIMFPLFTSIVVRTYAWTALFNRYGVINTLLLETGLIDQPLAMLNTEPVVLVGMVQAMLPFAILPIYTILLGLDLDLLRASAICGARGRQTFLKVVLPLTKQGAGVAAVLVFVISLGFYITPAILGGPRSAMISNLISTEVTTFYNLKGGAVMSVLLLAVTLCLLYIAGKIGSIAAHYRR
ncbi:ABC transporter permease [Sinorhizobium meliloti]|uniref:ABC transporter permease n=1 Tax=Rhizobium meliloti TaxID=382 RepID=UPI000FDC8D03|nr:ABC transporter permease [Sinorhizobium meliloti]MDE3775524.1 ABC transporter permease [Sinorhizobium meliloti]RVG97604.1 ABC transporter permease [Sinorhizobium meliloti]RVK68686.1 ABC transporter permease [Sinorhizobium meliloti]